jgi:hypothetical protein
MSDWSALHSGFAMKAFERTWGVLGGGARQKSHFGGKRKGGVTTGERGALTPEFTKIGRNSEQYIYYGPLRGPVFPGGVVKQDELMVSRGAMWSE